MSRKKVFICGLSQESNSFNPVLATLKSFGIRNMEVSTMDPSRGAREYLSAKDDIELIYGKDISAYSGGPVASASSREKYDFPLPGQPIINTFFIFRLQSLISIIIS
jgi:hypothetical protein